MFVVLLPNVFHTNDMFALSEKSAEKKTKTGRLPIAHYKQKPAGSDLWPVNRCIPRQNQLNHSIKYLLLCSAEEGTLFGTTRGWVNDDRRLTFFGSLYITKGHHDQKRLLIHTAKGTTELLIQPKRQRIQLHSIMGHKQCEWQSLFPPLRERRRCIHRAWHHMWKD